MIMISVAPAASLTPATCGPRLQCSDKREIRDKRRVNTFSIEQYYACVRVLKSVGSSEDIVVTDSGSVKNMKIYMNKDCKDHFLSIKNIAYDLALYPMSV